MRTVAIIPARGGSKGIPRKNLRPLGARPLLAWSIEAARRSGVVDAVIVSTDDDEIARVAAMCGAEVHRRPEDLGQDAVTLDPVIFDAVSSLEAQGRSFDLVLTIQPTSPLLQASTIAAIVARFEQEPVDTVLTAVDDTHLSWENDAQGQPVPAYTARVNRQSLPPRFKETGGVLAARRAAVGPESRIGERVALHVVDGLEGTDIDSSDDWLIAEAAMARRRVAFVVVGTRKTGLGHATRVLTLLERLSAHHCRVFADPAEDLALELLHAAYAPVETVPRDALLPALQRFGADVVVHDELDTRREHLEAERDAGFRIVTLEDQGAGPELADAVINALYPAEQSSLDEHRYFGPNWYCLRESFRHRPPHPFAPDAKRVLLTFGGSDPSGLTFKVLNAIAPGCPAAITIVAGRGLDDFDALASVVDEHRASGSDIELLRDVSDMAEVMSSADVAFSSAGRTLYELASLHVPAIVLAQNAQELKHTFADPSNGFLFLGLGAEVADDAISAALATLLHSPGLRRALCDRMARVDLKGGRDRVVRLILGDVP